MGCFLREALLQFHTSLSSLITGTRALSTSPPLNDSVPLLILSPVQAGNWFLLPENMVLCFLSIYEMEVLNRAP